MLKCALHGTVTTFWSARTRDTRRAVSPQLAESGTTSARYRDRACSHEHQKPRNEPPGRRLLRAGRSQPRHREPQHYLTIGTIRRAKRTGSAGVLKLMSGAAPVHELATDSTRGPRAHICSSRATPEIVNLILETSWLAKVNQEAVGEVHRADGTTPPAKGYLRTQTAVSPNECVNHNAGSNNP